MLDTSNTPSPLNTTPRPDELTSVRKLPVMFGQVPNILGTFTSPGVCSGAVTYMSDYDRLTRGDAFLMTNKQFDANAYNDIYKAYASVQAPALQVLPCIKF